MIPASEDSLKHRCESTPANTGRLNGSQGEAIRAALGQTLTLWQGPPGTGKTRTLAHLLAVAKDMLPRGSIIACAASNVAVDNLVTALVSLDVHVVRVGQPVKVSLKAWSESRGSSVDCQKSGAEVLGQQEPLGSQEQSNESMATRHAMHQDFASKGLEMGLQVFPIRLLTAEALKLCS